jgi:branched-chain amino acid transport system permease protein
LSLPLSPLEPAAAATLFYYLLFAALLLSVWVTYEFSRRRIGAACGAIRSNEQKAEAAGLRRMRYKTATWMISATLTGVVGSINAYWVTYIDPPALFDMAIAVKAFVIFLLGGGATVLGPIGGAFVVEILHTLKWSHLLNWHLGAMGVLIIAVIVLFPKGLREGLKEIRGRIDERR